MRLAYLGVAYIESLAELWTQSASVKKKLCDDSFNDTFVIHLSLYYYVINTRLRSKHS